MPQIKQLVGGITAPLTTVAIMLLCNILFTCIFSRLGATQWQELLHVEHEKYPQCPQERVNAEEEGPTKLGVTQGSIITSLGVE